MTELSHKEIEYIRSWFNKQRVLILKSMLRRYHRSQMLGRYLEYYTNAISGDVSSILMLPNTLMDQVPAQHQVVDEYAPIINNPTSGSENFNNLGTNLYTIYKGNYVRYQIDLIYNISKYLRKLGYEGVRMPSMSKPINLIYSGHLPGWGDDLFQTTDGIYLIPTSEALLANLKGEGKYFCYSECFRREAGSRGKRDKGMIRTCQFDKIEIFITTTLNRSYKEFKHMFNTISELLKMLQVHFRIVKLPYWDMSKGSMLTLDFEVWMPISKRWLEVSSLSYMGDWQNRFKNISLNKHTVCMNGTCLPIGRMIAVLSEYGPIDDRLSVLLKHFD